MKTCRSLKSAFTLVEMLISVACGTMILAAVLTAGIALQRSFAAVEGYSVAEGDQLRVLDYIAMDCRRASSASVANNVLTLTLPVYYTSASSGTPVAPTLSSGGVLAYGSGSVSIIYQQSSTNFTREVVVKDSTGTVTSDVTIAIAKNVSTFTVLPQDHTTTLSCSITFNPSFTYLAGPGPIAGTTVYCNTFLRNAAARL
jgi:Tfp pilus assembly protein PilW